MVKELSLFTIENVVKANEKFMNIKKEGSRVITRPISEEEINYAFSKAIYNNSKYKPN